MKSALWLSLSAVIAAFILLLPLIYVFYSWNEPNPDIWSHLLSTVLQEYVINSLTIAFFAALIAIFFGAGTAYMVTQYDFFGRRQLQVALILPLAMPAYIIAYTYTGMFDFAGPFQGFIRELFNLQPNARVLPDIRNLTGAIFMLGLVLYPYVYMLARVAFQQQPQAFIDLSTLNNVGRWRHFTKVQVPLIRPAVFTGALLVMMESLADYGTVAYFGINTFSTGIYRTWFGMGNRAVAAQLASLLTIVVFIVLYFEQKTRRDARQYQNAIKSKLRLIKPSKLQQALFFVLCLLPVLFGFVIPSLQLGWWALVIADNDYQGFWQLLLNSFKVSSVAAIFIVILAIFYTWLVRHTNSNKLQLVNKILTLGYALPGIVIAVGVVSVTGYFDRSFNQMTMSMFDWRPGLIFSGSLVALVFAYSLRYLSVALQNTETGFARIPYNLDQSALLLNPSKSVLLIKIHLPLLSSSIMTAALLVFVDVLKELPATLVLRPFNFNTLAVRAYELASDERLIDAALPAISIVMVGLLPVYLLMLQMERSRH